MYFLNTYYVLGRVNQIRGREGWVVGLGKSPAQAEASPSLDMGFFSLLPVLPYLACQWH